VKEEEEEGGGSIWKWKDRIYRKPMGTKEGPMH
jgi:hypothetical protein